MLNNNKVRELCNVFDIDLSVLKKNMLDDPDEYWDEEVFLMDKLGFIFNVSAYNNKMCKMDYFPRTIQMENKFPKLELFYTSNDKHGFNDLYFQEEKKHLSVLSKLWAYSSICLESSIFYDTAFPDKILEDEQFQSTKQLFSREKIITIDEWKVLKYLFSLSLKDYISVCIYFTDLKIILWLKGLCSVLYICDKEQEEFVRTICTTEGLYLRL